MAENNPAKTKPIKIELNKFLNEYLAKENIFSKIPFSLSCLFFWSISGIDPIISSGSVFTTSDAAKTVISFSPVALFLLSFSSATNKESVKPLLESKIISATTSCFLDFLGANFLRFFLTTTADFFLPTGLFLVTREVFILTLALFFLRIQN